MGKPGLYDINTFLQAGINPASTGINKNVINAYLGQNVNGENLKPNLKRFIQLQDEQDALNRFKWNNLPKELEGNLIERLLYYRGQGMFFYIKTMDKFFFLPYALSGTIDVYGRFLTVTPVPFAGGKVDSDGKLMPWITGLTRDVVYQLKDDDTEDTEEGNSENEDESEIDDTKCVLLFDYSKQLSETIVPRNYIQQPIIDVMSDIIPFMRTNLISASGVSAMRVNNEDEQSNVKAASDAVYMAGLTGKKWIPIVGNVDFQDLSAKAVGTTEDYFMAFQSLDNLRMSGYGLGGGVFNKLGSTLQSEADRNNVNTQLILQDALEQRQKFCDLVNETFGLNISCEIASDVAGDGSDSEEEGNDVEGEDNESTIEASNSEGE